MTNAKVAYDKESVAIKTIKEGLADINIDQLMNEIHGSISSFSNATLNESDIIVAVKEGEDKGEVLSMVIESIHNHIDSRRAKLLFKVITNSSNQIIIKKK